MGNPIILTYSYFSPKAEDGNLSLGSREKRINDVQILLNNGDFIQFEDGRKCYSLPELVSAIEGHDEVERLSGQKELQQKVTLEEKVYYEGTIENTSCRISSSMWMFNGTTFPVKSISSVSLFKRGVPLWAKILPIMCIVLFIIDGMSTYILTCAERQRRSDPDILWIWWIGWDEWIWDFLVFCGSALLIFIVGKLLVCEGIRVTSHSGIARTVAKSRGDCHGALKDLENAAIKCLKENS